MIARIFILLPYAIFVPADAELPALEVTLNGHVGRIYPPYQSCVDRSILEVGSPEPLLNIGDQLGPAITPVGTDALLIDGRASVRADALCIEFSAEEFDRRQAADEPRVEVAFGIANDLLGRLRTLGRAGHIKPISRASTAWRLVYLNDDGSELEQEEGLKRGLGGISSTWKFFAIREDLWLAAAEVPDEFAPAAWDTLFLDALDLVPEVGPALVLLLAAVETRLESALDLQADAQSVNADLWAWLNGRGTSRRRGPTLVEQADSLLASVSGRTLKEDERLWRAFQDLRKARNSFVHSGVAEVDGVAVAPDQVSGLIPLVGEILDWIEQLLPADKRRPRYDAEGEQFVQMTKSLIERAPEHQAPDQPEPDADS